MFPDICGMSALWSCQLLLICVRFICKFEVILARLINHASHEIWFLPRICVEFVEYLELPTLYILSCGIHRRLLPLLRFRLRAAVSFKLAFARGDSLVVSFVPWQGVLGCRRRLRGLRGGSQLRQHSQLQHWQQP
jgi:hypothetical protein